MAKALLLDLSGVLYDGDVLLPGALEAVRRVQGSDLEVRFITNTSQKTRADLLAHLRGFGFSVEEPQLFTAVDAGLRLLGGGAAAVYRRGCRPAVAAAA
jgi:ribonucleotide monophosphatase NagD (HAD superfamily)